jgi:hypothetical protein
LSVTTESTRPLPFHKLPQESLRFTLLATRLNDDIDHVAVLVDRPPQVVSAASDLHEHFIDVPCIA